jgi:hypothetical protein
MFTVTKKITKLDSSNAFTNFIGNVLGNQKQQSQGYAPKTQMPQVSPNMVRMSSNNMPNIPNPSDLRNYSQSFGNGRNDTETSDDMMPSRMSGPGNGLLGNDDNVDLENILKTMNVRKQEKEMIDDKSTDDIFKNIPMTGQKKRGRPRKAKMGVSKM